MIYLYFGCEKKSILNNEKKILNLIDNFFTYIICKFINKYTYKYKINKYKTKFVKIYY